MNVQNAASNGKPTVISLFAGCGGSSLGYQMAGFRECLAVEWNQDASATFRLNFPTVPVYEGDICRLTGEKCLKLAGLESGKLDVLDGSPPCQGFSTAGKRKFRDVRNDLFTEMVRLLQELKPKAFIMENVRGLVRGVMRQVCFQMFKDFSESGYAVKGMILDAAGFGVPQHRERLILIGIRSDLKVNPSYPIPTFNSIKSKDAVPTLGRSGNSSLFSNTELELKEAEVKPTWQAWRVLRGLERSKHFGMVRINPEKPSPTIMGDAGNTCTGLFHPYEVRKLTIAEIKRLAGFPDGFSVIGNYKSKWKHKCHIVIVTYNINKSFNVIIIIYS